MKRMISGADGEKIREVIQRCKGKNRFATPVAVVIVGMDSEQSDALVEMLAEKEMMEVIDRGQILRKFESSTPDEIDAEFKRVVNETVMQRKNVILKFNFGYGSLQRKIMVDAVKMGMKSAQVIALKLPAAPLSSFSYHEQKTGERFDSRTQREIREGLEYGRFDLSERLDWVLEAKF